MTASARSAHRSVRTLRRRIHWRDIGANWLAFTVMTLAALPAIWIILTAFRPNYEINASPPVWIPQTITFEAFESLLGLKPGPPARLPLVSSLFNSLALAIHLREDGRLIGTCAFSQLDADNGSALFHITIGERDAWGLGYGSEATELMPLPESATIRTRASCDTSSPSTSATRGLSHTAAGPGSKKAPRATRHSIAVK